VRRGRKATGLKEDGRAAEGKHFGEFGFLFDMDGLLFVMKRGYEQWLKSLS
jgi:hypothetical protein